MSLIPFHPQEGREIVLRHRNAIVVRDPSSQRLEIRGLPECPTCHRPLGATSSPERGGFSGDEPATPILHHREGYVDPNYFRMLRAGHHSGQMAGRPPGSPVRRLFPLMGDGGHNNDNDNDDNNDDDDEENRRGPSRIRKEAFSPNYFRTFFVEERELGRGGKGVVLLVRHEIDGCQLGHFACKRVPVGDDHGWLEKVLVEVELLAKLSHPNLVSYRHVWLENVTLTRFGPSVACAFILQQYCNGGDLLHYVVGDQPQAATKEQLKAQMRRRSRGGGQAEERPDHLWAPRQLQFDEIYSLFRDVTAGLAYLHAANYIHRDLKPSNCLLHREGRTLTCLISDFGEVQPEHVVRRSTGTTGTISYCAPEVLRQDLRTGRYGNFSTKSDIFSLGMILHFLCFGRLPYRGANVLHEELEDVALLRQEIAAWPGFRDARRARPDLPAPLYQLLTRLLSAHPAERPSASEVLLIMRSQTGVMHETSPVLASPPPLGLAARRIQNLDSPLSTGTPVPDPTKPSSGSPAPASVADGWDEAVADSDDDDDIVINDRQKHRPSVHSLTLTRSRGPSQSPERVRLHHGSSSSLASPTSPRRRRSSPLRPALSSSTAPAASADAAAAAVLTPLLLPPPPTPSGLLWWRRALVAQRYAARLWVAASSAELVSLASLLLRIGLFLAKMAALAQPCWPFAVRWGLGASLAAVAALDLARPGSRRLDAWRVSLLLLVLHAGALWVAARWGVLCAGRRPEAWEW